MKKYAVLIVVTLIMVLCIFAFLYHFCHNDDRKLSEFSGAYAEFDRAIANFSHRVFGSNLDTAPATDDLEREADEALAELNAKAAARISSLTRNDGDLMNVMVEISDLSGKELAALKGFQTAAAGMNANADKLAKALDALTNERLAVYSRFRVLAWLKN